MNESQKDFLLIVGLFGLGVIGVLFLMLRSGASPFRGSRAVAERDETEVRQPVETREPVREPSREPVYAPPAEPARRPDERPAEPSSPGVRLGFDDIERACGDLYSSNYLCLVNRGNEPAAGGARLVIDDGLASFSGRGTYNNGISISVEGKERYRLDFGPPKGKSLIPGLYTGAMRWPFNEGPYPGIDVGVGSSGCNTEEGQFRILKIQLSGNTLQQFVADFETTCNGAVGRIAIGGSSESFQRRSLSQPLR